METLTYKAKVQADGSLIMAKSVRDTLGLQQGEEIEISVFLPQNRRQRTATNNGHSVRKERIVRYLQECIQRSEVTSETVLSAQKALEAIENILPHPLTDVSTGSDGQVFYVWDCAEHHLILEVFPKQVAELFYHNRTTDTIWGHDYTVGEELPQGVMDKIRKAFEESA